MLQFHYRPAGEGRVPHHANAGMSFVVKYVPPGSASAVTCEKSCANEITALNFCVVLRNLGGVPAEMLQFIHGQLDAVLDGRDLEDAIDRQCARLETEAVPPWR